NPWILHLENIPVHTTLYIREFLTGKEITLVFPKLRQALRGTRFDEIDNIEDNNVHYWSIGNPRW
ncbi:hypothetical protein WH47_06916, partial [Habropoda laboriosa]